jgi:carbon starvation protein CstA
MPPVNKTIFSLANYLLLGINVFLSINMLRFLIEVVPSDESLLPILPTILSLLIIMINCVFNLVINYKVFRNKIISNQTRLSYLISGICFILSVVIMLFYLIVMYSDELKADPDSNFYKLILFFILVFVITGLIIAINQFRISKHLKRFAADNLD